MHYRAAPVRAAVRTLTLNLYAIEAPGVQAFLAGPQAAAYFTDLGAYMTERCQVSDVALWNRYFLSSSFVIPSARRCILEYPDVKGMHPLPGRCPTAASPLDRNMWIRERLACTAVQLHRRSAATLARPDCWQHWAACRNIQQLS
jgi:hypothetical protein